MIRFVRIGRVEDVPVGEGRALQVGRESVAIFRISDEEFRALDGRCPHAGGPLADGILAGRKVICPLHGWTVCVDSGNTTGTGSCGEEVRRIPVEVRGSDVYLGIEVANRCIG